MFFKRREKQAVRKEEKKIEEPIQDVCAILAQVQTCIRDLEGKTLDDRIAALDEIGILYAQAQYYDEAIVYLEKSLSEKKALGNGYRTLLNVYNIKRREAAQAKDDEKIQYYLVKIDEMMAISKEVTRASF